MGISPVVQSFLHHPMPGARTIQIVGRRVREPIMSGIASELGRELADVAVGTLTGTASKEVIPDGSAKPWRVTTLVWMGARGQAAHLEVPSDQTVGEAERVAIYSYAKMYGIEVTEYRETDSPRMLSTLEHIGTWFRRIEPPTPHPQVVAEAIPGGCRIAFSKQTRGPRLDGSLGTIGKRLLKRELGSSVRWLLTVDASELRVERWDDDTPAEGNIVLPREQVLLVEEGRVWTTTGILAMPAIPVRPTRVSERPVFNRDVSYRVNRALGVQ